MPDHESSRYEPQGEIARGGMGIIYKVRDCDLDRTLAMKRMMAAPDLDGGAAEIDRFSRFMEEAHVTAQLDHPGIVPVYDLGTDADGCAWYTMKMVRGRELGEVIKAARKGEDGWNLPRLVGVLVRACQAVAYAHGKGVIHRDLKPANIMVGDLGEVYVMDWGLAKQLGREDVHDIRLQLGDRLARSGMETIVTHRGGAEGGSSLDAPLMTMDGAVIGTPAYMPPEQAAGIVDQIDHLSDIYALGAVLYEMLSETPPYHDSRGKTRASEILTSISNGPPTRVRDLRADAPPELAAICEKAMSRIREERYGSAIDLAEDLQAFLDGRVVRAHQTGALAEFKKWVLRNKATAAAAAAAVVTLAALAAVQTFAKREVTAALKNEEAALKATQITLADSYTALGLQEAERWEYARAKLWFDAAAELAAGDPVRAEASRLRARSFGALAAKPLRAAMMEVQVWSFHEAHPSLPYFITHGRAEKARWVFDADRCRFVGKSDGFLGSFSALAFDPLKPAFAASPSDGRIEWRGLPEGEILDSIDLSGGGIGAIDQLAVSPDGALVFIASGDGFIYDLETKSLWPARLADCGDLFRARFRGDGAFLVMAGRFGGSGTRLFRIDAENRAATEVPLEDVAGQPPRTSGEELPEFVGDQYLLNHSGGFVFYHEVESGRCGGYIKGVIPAPGKWRQWIGPTAWPQPLKRALRETPEHRYDLTASELRMPGGQSAITRLTKEVTNLEDGFRSALPHFIGMPVGFLNGGGSRGALAVTREDHLFRLWRLPPEGRLWTVPCAGKSAPVFSADGRFAAAAGKAQREIRVFDLAARAEAGTAFTLPESDVARCADFSPDDGAVIAIGIHELIENDNDRDEMPVPGRVEFWDWRSGERLGDPVALPAQPLALRFHPGGGWVAVACQGGQVYRLARGVGEPELLFNADPALPLDSLTFTEGGAALIAARSGSSGSSQTYVWDVGAGGFRFSPFPVGGHGFPKFVDVKGGVFITPNAPTLFRDLSTGEHLASPLDQRIGDTSLLFGNDPGTVLTSARTAAARVLDWRTGEPRCPDLVHGFRDERWVHRTLPIPGTPWVAVCGLNGARFFDSRSGLPVAAPVIWTEDEAYLWFTPRCRISPDGRTLAFSGGNPIMHFVDLQKVFGGDDNRDPEFDELAAGARLIEGGLSGIPAATLWLDRFADFIEARPDDPRLQITGEGEGER